MMSLAVLSRVLRIIPSGLLVGALIAGCATAPPRPPAPIQTGQPRDEPVDNRIEVPDIETGPLIDEAELNEDLRNQSRFLTPEFMASRDVKRIGVLLPFSSSNAGVRRHAESLLAAIELALFDSGVDDILIMPRDTGGDARKAAEATAVLVDEGADVLVGPLFAESVRAAATVARARDIPIIGFSNEQSAAGGGAYLMSFPPEEEVARTVDWAALRGIDKFAFMGPSDEYSRRIETALRFEAARRGAAVVGAEFYSPQDEAPVDAAQNIARRIKSELALGAQTVGVFLPERGEKLRSVAPLLSYYGVDVRRVQFLGTAIWAEPAIAREAVMRGAVFAAPDPADAQIFESAFKNGYDRSPTALASLGYDASAMAIGLLSDGAVTQDEIRDIDGFRGVNGLFRFRNNGTIERGLAIMSVQSGGAERVEPAPPNFASRGS